MLHPKFTYFSKLIACRFLSTKITVHKQNIFDRRMKAKQREIYCKNNNFETYSYIKSEIGYRVADRLSDVKRHFPIVVELSSGTGFISTHLTDSNDIVDHLIACDISEHCLNRVKILENINVIKLLVDDEQIPFKENSIDAFICSLNIHWINKLPATFKTILKCLRNDGVFIGSLFGGQTLFELRCSLQIAEIEREGGFSPHISPFIEPTDIATLLTHAGFTMLTIDSDDITINYPSMFELMYDLQDMAESNVSWNRKLHLNRNSMLAAASIYKQMYGNKDGTVPATYHVFYFIGWKPDPSQPKPAKRGSQNISFKELSDLIEKHKKENTSGII